MRKYLVVSIVALAISFMGFGPEFAKGDPSDGKLKTEIYYSGIVESVGGAGEGLVLYVTPEGEDPYFVTVYGIGPTSYWKYLEVDKPDVEEEIEVFGHYHEGIDKNIAEIIIIGDDEIVLRDPDTGKPLWRKNPRKLGHK